VLGLVRERRRPVLGVDQVHLSDQMLVGGAGQPRQTPELACWDVPQGAPHGERLPRPVSAPELHEARQAPRQGGIVAAALARAQAYRQVDDVEGGARPGGGLLSRSTKPAGKAANNTL
jgi:hypothetical protein